MASKARELVQECRRQHENCLYTSTALFEWLSSVRLWRRFFVVTPLILGSLAGWSLLTEMSYEGAAVLTAVCSFLAGLLPTIYAALKLEEGEKPIATSASEYKNLQDRFRQCAAVSSGKPFGEFEAEFRELMGRMEEARRSGLSIPKRFFRRAQKRVQSGDYTFDVDIEGDEGRPTNE